jgi:hypothetical protein
MVAIFLAFGSMGLAYGLMQRGLFKDVESLEKQLVEYEDLMLRYSRPTIDEFTYTEPEELKKREAQHNISRNKFAALRHIYGIKRMFADSFISDLELFREWHDSNRISRSREKELEKLLKGRNIRPWRKIKQWLRLDGRLSLPASGIGSRLYVEELKDYLYPPEETQAYESYKEERKHLEEQQAQLTGQIAHLESKISKSEANIEGLLSLTAQAKSRKTRLTKEYEQKLLYLTMQNKREMLKFVEAYSLGRFVALRLRYEPPDSPFWPTHTETEPSGGVQDASGVPA